MHESEKWKGSRSVVSDSSRPHGLQPTRLLHPWDSPGKNTGVDCHFLLQGIFPTQGLNPGLLHCRWILYHWAISEALMNTIIIGILFNFFLLLILYYYYEWKFFFVLLFTCNPLCIFLFMHFVCLSIGGLFALSFIHLLIQYINGKHCWILCQYFPHPVFSCYHSFAFHEQVLHFVNNQIC